MRIVLDEAHKVNKTIIALRKIVANDLISVPVGHRKLLASHRVATQRNPAAEASQYARLDFDARAHRRTKQIP